MKYLIIILALSIMPAAACEFERGAHPYVRVAAGWTGQFDDGLKNDGELAAQIELGIRFPLNENWLLDAKISHDSWWFEDNDGDEARDHINFGLEYQW